MYRNKCQKTHLTLLHSIGRTPLTEWSIHSKNGYCKRSYDDDLKSLVLELISTNISNHYITTPRDPKKTLGIKLPFLVLLVKNLGKYFTFEVKIIDDQNFNRRFRVSNFSNRTTVTPFSTSMPMCLSRGWNQIHFNLADFTRRAYGTSYMEAVRLSIHANVRIRRIYFANRLYPEDEIPNEYRLVPTKKQKLPLPKYQIPSARPPSPARSQRSVKKPKKRQTTFSSSRSHISLVSNKSNALSVHNMPRESNDKPQSLIGSIRTMASLRSAVSIKTF